MHIYNYQVEKAKLKGNGTIYEQEKQEKNVSKQQEKG